MQFENRSTAAIAGCSLLLWMVMTEVRGMPATAQPPAAAESPASVASEPGDLSPATDPSGAIQSVTLDDSDVTESSGLALSNRTPGRLWTHNDSGGKSIIYAFDSTGKPTGSCRLRSVESKDWEDMSSLLDRGVPRLLVADCGDNQALRPSISLYLLDEPDPDRTTETRKVQAIEVRYPDGPRDCEAVAVDTHSRQIILIAKSRFLAAGIYVVPLPERQSEPGDPVSVIAKRIGTLPMPMITAMDVDPRSGDIWIVNYFQAVCFSCSDRSETINERLSGRPSAYELPHWKQIEAVAVDRMSAIWVTTEGSPGRLGRVRIPLPARNP